jgi:hypothetical protein
MWIDRSGDTYSPCTNSTLGFIIYFNVSVSEQGSRLLTSEDIKEIIRKRIAKQEKKIRPNKQSLREVEDHLIVLETLQNALAAIGDEERLREIISGESQNP